MDGHMAQNNNKTNKFFHQVGTTLRILEVGTPWANCAELNIGLFKEAVRRDLRMKNAPMVFWNYFMEHQVLINNTVPRQLFQKQYMYPHEATCDE